MWFDNTKDPKALENKEKLDTLVDAIQSQRDKLSKLRDVVADASPEYLAEMDIISKEREKLSEREEIARTKLKESLFDVLEDVAKCESTIEKKEVALKAFCKALPKAFGEAGFKYERNGYSVGVSKTTYVTQYNSEKLLENHPELLDVSHEGDSLIARVVNGPLLERLIDQDVVEIPDIENYRTYTKAREPSVTLATKGGK